MRSTMLRGRPVYVQAYLLFMALMIPTYAIEYGPMNFLYFCDLALLVALTAFLTEDKEAESRLLSAALCGMLIPQSTWVWDFFKCVLGHCQGNNLTAYMFNPKLSLYLRWISFFHVWLPFYLIYGVKQSGYHPYGWITWSKLAAFVLVICYMVSPPPGGPPEYPRNINYVYGWDDEEIRLPCSRPLWLVYLMLAGPLLLYFPSHLICLFAASMWRRLNEKWIKHLSSSAVKHG